MFCSKCGSEIQSNNMFCTNCGNPVTDSKSRLKNILPKQSKKKLIAIIGCAVIAISLLIGIISGIVSLVTADDYKDVATKYLEASWRYDYDEIKKYLPYDVDKMFYNMFCAKCRKEKISLRDGFEELERQLGVKINGADDLMSKCYKEYAGRTHEKNKAYLEELQVLYTKELRDYEIEDIFDEDDYNKYDLGIYLEDYVDKNKIKECYKVMFSITLFSNGEYLITYEAPCYVVKYDGKWKVLDMLYFITVN